LPSPYRNLIPQTLSMTNDFLLGCDWGTSSFRLRLIRLSDHSVAGELCTSEGIAPTYTAWQASGQDRLAFFRRYLTKQAERLAAQTDISAHRVPIVVSGMVTSTMGMCEVPYARTPFDLEGTQTLTHRLHATVDFPHELLLISGVRSEHDVMRGEETQLIGLAKLASLSDEPRAVVILPGTHSKHLFVQNGRLVDIQTFMTGEVYSLLSTHSILKDSVETSGVPALSEQEKEAFLLGIQAADASGILKGLFRVRTNQLFQKLNKNENALYLSGLLIGSELSHLPVDEHNTLILCSGSVLFEPYHLAMQALRLTERTRIIPARILDQATVAGQVRIFQQQQTLIPDNPIF
jgi:2-dehydro-3-deoxygalactonokinase